MDWQKWAREDLLPAVKSKAAGAAAGALVTAVAGFISKIPLFWVLVGSAVVWAAVMGGLAAWAYLKRPIERAANVEEWRDHEAYAVWQAACLWVDVEPHPEIIPGTRAYAPLQRLKSAIETGALETIGEDQSMKGRVLHDALYTYAAFTGRIPAFLEQKAHGAKAIEATA